MCAQPSPTPTRPARGTVAWVGLSLLLFFLGVAVCFMVVLPLQVGNQGCAAAQIPLLCSTPVQLAMYWLPLGGLALGLLVSVVVGLRRHRSGRSPVVAAVIGWVVFVVAAGVTVLVALQ
ncbi:MAG TPA: hypothetical protein VFE65_25435 [Pseudonocardia sp.]|jgi:hypothetical protein|nr:hypothetical protein [Pseudonocardia sp.]